MAFETVTDGTPTNGANPLIDSLVTGGRWADVDGGLTTIAVSVKEGANPLFGFGGVADLFLTGATWLDLEVAALAQALVAWQSVANIEFVATAPVDADIWYWVADGDDLDGLGIHDFPVAGPGEPLYGAFNYEGMGWDTAGLTQGGFGFITLLHEIGHGLGLAHPHDGAASVFGDGTVFPGVSSENDSGDNDLNQGIWTTMSYVDGWSTQFPGHSDTSFGWQGTPMAFDIAAIQAIYGANTSYRTGTDAYALPLSNGAGTFWSSIWDAGGTDTITAAGAGASSLINLNAAPLAGPNAGGFVSTVLGIVGGFTIANGVVIEHAIGGGGGDILIGNSVANILDGGAGDDLLSGGLGGDTLDGGGNTDTADYSDRTLSVAVVLNGAANASVSVGGVAEDTIRNIENLTGGSAADTLTGDGVANLLSGGLGNDLLKGGLGGDTLDGGGNTDTADYSDKMLSVAAVLNGAANAGVSVGGVAEDTIRNIENLTGGSAADKLIGDGLLNVLAGGAGKDLLRGGLGKDTLDGGSSIDTADYSDKTVAVSVTLSGATKAIVKVGGVVEDTIRNIENLTSGRAADTLIGDLTANSFVGGGGNDTLNGRQGKDTLNGGNGNDRFLFDTSLSVSSNVDHIASFVRGSDKIVLDDDIFTRVGSSITGNEIRLTTQAPGLDDRLIYNRSTGGLSYDPNGGNASNAVLFAILDNRPASLSGVDFTVIA